MNPMRIRLITITLAATLAAFGQQRPQPAPPQIPDDIQADLNVVYSRVGETVAMDILRPKTAGANPTIVAIHGGGFRAGSRKIGRAHV